MTDLYEMIKEHEPSLSEWVCQGEIGRGRFGVVYKITKSVGRYINEQASALKIVEFDSKASAAQRTAINVINALKNEPHAVSIDDYFVVPIEMESGEHTSYLAYRMELLSELPAEELREEEAICLAVDMCDILMTCHGSKPAIYHCDIKPENILVSPDGSFKLGDFGEAQYKAKHTNASEVGTDGFRAPELYNGKRYDNRCDLYSLGVTLYTLLNKGQLPFGDVDSTVAAQLKGKRFPRLKGISSDFMRIIWKLCQHKPSARFESARELTAALLPLVSRRYRKKRFLSGLRAKDKDPDSQGIVPSAQSAVEDRSAVEGISADLDFKATVREADLFIRDTVPLSESSHSNELPRASEEMINTDNINIVVSELPERSLESVYRRLKRLHFSEYYIPFHVKRMVICILAAALLTTVLYCTYIRPRFAFVGGRFITVTTNSLDFSDMGVSDIRPLARCTELTSLDITGNEVSKEDFDYLSNKLSECRIVWDVPVGTSRIRSDVQTIDLEMLGDGNEADLMSMLPYFESLALIDLSGSDADNKELINMRENIPNCDVIWTVELEGKVYRTDEKNLTLSRFDSDIAETLKCFGHLEWVDLSDSGLSNEELAALREEYPSYNILWSILVHGKKLRTDTKSIDLSYLPNIDGISERLNELRYFTQLRELNLSNTELSDYSFLQSCSSLRALYFNNRDLYYDQEYISDMPALDLSILSDLTGLIKLDIEYSTIYDLSFIKNLNKLQYLDLTRCYIVKEFEEEIFLGLDQLWYLDISFSSLVNMDFSVFKELPRLTELIAYYDHYRPGGWGHATMNKYDSLKGIKGLKVFAAEIHPRMIQRILGECKELTVLVAWGLFSNTEFIPFFMEDIYGFNNLKCLYAWSISTKSKDLAMLPELEIVAGSMDSNCKKILQSRLPECEIVDIVSGSYSIAGELGEIYIPEYFEAMDAAINQ